MNNSFEKINELFSNRYGSALYVFNRVGDLPTERENRYLTLKGLMSGYVTHTYLILRGKLPKFIGYTTSDSRITYLVSGEFSGWDWGHEVRAKYVIMATTEKAYLGITYNVSDESFSEKCLQELPPIDSDGNFITNKGLLTKPTR